MKLNLYITTFLMLIFVFDSSAVLSQDEEMIQGQYYYNEETDQINSIKESVDDKNVESFDATSSEVMEQAEDEIIIIESEELPWIAMQEPPKSDQNRLRITYEEGQNTISLEDKIAIDSMIKLNEEEGLNFKISSHSSSASSYENSLAFSILRLQKLAVHLKSKGIEYDENKYFAYPSEQNEYEVNYIDIDKL